MPKVPNTLNKWRKAAQQEGYMQKGNFKKLPKKGSDAYKRIQRRVNKDKK